MGQARDGYAEAVEILRRAGDVRRASMNEQNLADTYNRLGAYAEAEQALRRALAGCREVGHRIGEAYACANLGYACAMQGRCDEALEWLDRAADYARRNEDPRLSACVRLYRARALVRAGDGDSAAREATAALEEAQRGVQRALSAQAESVLARALLILGSEGEAEDASRRAMQLRDAADGLVEDEAEVFLVRAEALDACGRAEEAETVRAHGRARVRDLASRIADPGWRERFVRDVPAHRALLEGA